MLSASGIRSRAIGTLVACCLAQGSASRAASTTRATPSSDSASQRVARLSRKSVVVVECSTAADRPVLGSGFYLSSTGLVATNAHVVEDCQGVFVREDRETLPSNAQIVLVSAEHDVAFLKVPGDRKPALILAPVESLSQGQEVFAIGHPAGLEYSVSDGIISAFRKVASRRLIQTTAPISPGSSGGPLLDASGRVVGMTTAYLDNGQNLNFAVPADILKEHLELAKARPESSTEPPVMTPETVVRIAAKLKRRKEFSRAEELLRSALERSPNDLSLLLELGDLLWERGDTDGAERITAKMLEIDPDFGPAHQCRSAELFEKGDLTGASAAARRSLDLKVTGKWRADAYQTLMLVDLAKAKADPSNQSVLLEQALEKIEEVLKHEGYQHDPQTRILRAELLQHLGRANAANREARAVLNLPGVTEADRKALHAIGLPTTNVKVVSFDQAKNRVGVMTGIVVNRGDEAETSIGVKIECKDTEGRVVGVGTAVVEPARLSPGDSGSFEAVLKGPMCLKCQCFVWTTPPSW